MDLQLKQMGGPLPNRAFTDKDTCRICKQKVTMGKRFSYFGKEKRKQGIISQFRSMKVLHSSLL